MKLSWYTQITIKSSIKKYINRITSNKYNTSNKCIQS